MSKKVCIITGTRAEYGLLFWLMDYIKKDATLDLQIIATGMHLSDKFGMTYKEIERDGFRIDGKVDLHLDSDSSKGVLKSMSVGLKKFPVEFEKLNPDLVVLLGDRFEIFCAATAAMLSHIPIVHLHGGETTIGSMDESMRHAITKMSQIHFVATNQYKNRVVQLGEHPDRVFCVGGLGIDNICKLDLISKEGLEKELQFKFNKKNLLVTFHPVTLEPKTSEKYMHELLSALDELEETNIIFTMPNADIGGDIIFKLIEEFVSRRDNVKAFKSLGQLKYLSCIKYIDAVIGNSSSGILEVPTFKKATINIGNRQKGRVMADSVINCEVRKESILNAIKEIYTDSFKERLSETVNPYGQGGASKRIVNKIKTISLENILKKEFYNVESK